MEIVPYSEDYFERLISFLRENWVSNHSIYDTGLFDWQYGGCVGGPSSSVLLLDDSNEIHGFLGVISYPFLFCDTIKKSAGLAIWIVDKNIKNSGVGLYLKKAVEENFDIVYTIGINPATIRYYQKHNYNYCASLNRYVVPLDTEGYQLFLTEPCDNKDVKEWLNTIQFVAPAIPTSHFNATALAEAYQSNTAPYFTLRPQKDETFWKWRYLNSKGFSYMFYQGMGGIVVFRVENVHSPEDSLRHGIKCLRIIEILPLKGEVWNGDEDNNLTETILSVLTWAKEHGCVLADFQISNSRLNHILNGVGFQLHLDKGKTSVVHLFSPYRTNAAPLNFTYRVLGGSEYISVDREDTYFLKSDTDMDRPNFLQ